MGNQPPRKNIPGKGGKSRHSKKMVDDAKKFLSSKKYDDANKIALSAGLKDSGKSFLAAAVLASAAAYRISKERGISKITQSEIDKTINNVIRQRNFDVTKQGRTFLKSGITKSVFTRSTE